MLQWHFFFRCNSQFVFDFLKIDVRASCMQPQMAKMERGRRRPRRGFRVSYDGSPICFLEEWAEMTAAMWGEATQRVFRHIFSSSSCSTSTKRSDGEQESCPTFWSDTSIKKKVSPRFFYPQSLFDVLLLEKRELFSEVTKSELTCFRSGGTFHWQCEHTKKEERKEYCNFLSWKHSKSGSRPTMHPAFDPFNDRSRLASFRPVLQSNFFFEAWEQPQGHSLIYGAEKEEKSLLLESRKKCLAKWKWKSEICVEKKWDRGSKISRGCESSWLVL